MSLIDVWNIETFDDDLGTHLRDATNLIYNYFTTSRRQYLEREASDHTQPYPINPYSCAYGAFIDNLCSWLKTRSIRAWHYTRMTDAEVAALMRDGIHLSSPSTLHRRLNEQIDAGAFSAEVAAALLAGSPLQNKQQIGPRSNKFWMVSHPLNIESSGVKLLLKSWGGEVVYFWQTDPSLQSLLQHIGRPRVIELAVPLASTKHDYSATQAVVSTYAHTLGCHTDSGYFDLYIFKSLGPEAVLKVHSEGDAAFTGMGRVYPAELSEVSPSN